MQSYIFQFSTSPISEDEYPSAEDLYSSNHMEYCEYPETESEENMGLEHLKKLLPSSIFTFLDDRTIRLDGSLEPLKQQWADRVTKAAAAINASTIADWDTRFQLVQAMRSALQTGWIECLFVNGDSNEVTYSTEFCCALLEMKVGDCMYIGAVLSYHY